MVEDWERMPVDRAVEHSMLYDVGQLAKVNIIEAEQGWLVIPDFLMESVRIFLRSVFLHTTTNHASEDLRRRVLKEVRDSGCTVVDRDEKHAFERDGRLCGVTVMSHTGDSGCLCERPKSDEIHWAETRRG